MNRRVVLYLLESEHGSALQYWSFEDEPLIRLGRSLENQVVIANPYISRSHAYLLQTDQGWCINALSEQGIFVESERFLHLPLVQGMVFRIGKSGPFLRFGLVGELASEMETVEAADPLVEMLHLDQDKLQREVLEIAEGDFFLKLKSRVQALREARIADPKHDREPSAGDPR